MEISNHDDLQTLAIAKSQLLNSSGGKNRTTNNEKYKITKMFKCVDKNLAKIYVSI